MAVVSAQGYTFHVCSVAGVESCCYVDSLDLAFDLGCIHGRVVSKSHVFISHGHVDHVQAFVAHAARRALQSMKPATYYVPSYLAPLLQQLLETSAKMQGDAPFAAKIVPLVPFQQVVLPNNLVVKAIPTVHRVPSLGFVVYKRKRRLRSDLVGVDSKEIAERRKLGEEVTEDALTPEIAYTGDTTAEVFRMSAASPEGGENSMRDLLRVKVLITEATYVDDMKTPEDAVSRGHIHLDQVHLSSLLGKFLGDHAKVVCVCDAFSLIFSLGQIVELEGLFVDVQTLLLVHFSARYSTVSLVEALERRVPASLCGKIMLGCR